jgi:hypothetical protein
MLGIPTRTLRSVWLTVLIAFVVVPVVGLPYAADDLANRAWATAGIGEQWTTILVLNGQWMDLQGRFFPGGSVYGFFVWNVFDSRVAYTAFLALLGLASVGLVGYAVWRATRSSLVTALGVLAMAGCWQFRFGYLDGLTSFAGLVPSTLVLTVGSGLLAGRLLHGGSRWLALPLVLGWSLAVTSYEVSLLMLPAVLVVLLVTGPPLRDRAAWLWAGLPLIVPAVVQVAVTTILRANASGPASAYEVNLAGPLGTTFLKQMAAALPLSQQALAGAPLNVTLAVMLAVVLSLPIVLAWRPWEPSPEAIPDRVGIALCAAGAWAWVVPAVLASITRRWQDELVWGQGYIYVGYQFAGVALVVVGVASLLRARADRRWARITFGVVFALVAVLCAATAASNLEVLGAIVPGPQGPG